MDDIKKTDKPIKHHYFFSWLSGGASAVSLALLLFIQSSNSQVLYASLLFAISIPFLVCSSAISGIVKAKNISTNKIDNIHTATLLYLFSLGGKLPKLHNQYVKWIVFPLHSKTTTYARC
jgi:hypothetical protein